MKALLIQTVLILLAFSITAGVIVLLYKVNMAAWIGIVILIGLIIVLFIICYICQWVHSKLSK